MVFQIMNAYQPATPARPGRLGEPGESAKPAMPATGEFNFSKAIIIKKGAAEVSEYSQRISNLLKLVKGHPNVGSFLGLDEASGSLLGLDDEGDFRYYGFETSVLKLPKFRFQTNKFHLTQSLVSQILIAVQFIHSKNIVCSSLDDPDSYVFYQSTSKDRIETVTVKLQLSNCFELEHAGHITKQSNMKDLARFFYQLFFKRPYSGNAIVNLLDKTLEDICARAEVEGKNRDPDHGLLEAASAIKNARFLPRHSNANKLEDQLMVTKNASYIVELADLISAVERCASGEDLISRPFLWTLKFKMNFVVDTREWCTCFATHSNTKIIEDLKKINLFLAEVGGHEWLSFSSGVLSDLLPEAGSAGGPPDGAITYNEKDSFHFLIAVRNFVVHRIPRKGAPNFSFKGLTVYRRIDLKSILLAFDRLLSMSTPHFLINVFKIMKTHHGRGEGSSFACYVNGSLVPDIEF